MSVQAKSCFLPPLVALLMAAGTALSATPPVQQSHERRESTRPIRPEGGVIRFQNEEGNVKEILDKEIRRSKPDYVVYLPKSLDGSTFDCGNEHFLVFDGPDGSLMALWTQTTYEVAGDHRVMFARSDDEGVSWSEPLFLAGMRKPEKGQVDWERLKERMPLRIFHGRRANFAYPIISKSGRIYIVYNQYVGIRDVDLQITGTMDCVYSDDNGKTWSTPGTIPMKRSPYDNPDAKYPADWIVWQMPHQDLKGRWYVGFTRWISTAVRTKPHTPPWTWAEESVVEFMRYENIDDHPEPAQIKITWFAWGDRALRVPHPTNPVLSVAQEPSIVRLPDERLFCTMRTMTATIWYSLSADDGETWCAPRPLLRRDHGKPILQPIFCCPIYRMADGRYLLIHHPAFGGTDPGNTRGAKGNRRPAFVALGEFRPGAEQPIWFSESKLLMDNDGVALGPLSRVDIGGYTSFTTRRGNNVLWHPERKFFLLGKKITPAILAGLEVPR